MKKIFLILIIPLISSCGKMQAQSDSKSMNQNISTSNQNLQNINNRLETTEVWDYCGDFLTRSDYEDCLSDELTKIEKKLSADYSDALKSMQKGFTPKDVENLKVAQKNWQAYREANCQAEKDTYGVGTDAVGAGFQCRLRLTKERLGEIKNIYGRK